MELATVPAAATATMIRRRSACSDDSEDYEFNSALSEAGSEESYDFCSLTSKDTASGSEFGTAGYGEHQSVLSEEKLSVICVHSVSDEDEENADASSQHHTIFTATDPSTDFDDDEQDSDNDTAHDDHEEQEAEQAEEEEEEEEEEEAGLQVCEQDSLITEHEVEYDEDEEEDEEDEEEEEEEEEQDEDEEVEPMEVEEEGCTYDEDEEEAQSEEEEDDEHEEDSDDEEEEEEEEEEQDDDDAFSTAEMAAGLEATTLHDHALHECSPRSRQMEDIDFILQMLGLALDTVSATSISRRVRECEPATCMGCGTEFPSRTQLRKHLMRAKSCRRGPRKLKEQIHEFQEQYGACLSLLNEAQKRAYVTLLYARALQIRIQH